MRPEEITGYYIQGNEAEVMIKPEDLKLLHYEIPNTKTMVERMYEWTNRDVLAPVQLKWGAFTNGLVALTIMMVLAEQVIYLQKQNE